MKLIVTVFTLSLLLLYRCTHEESVPPEVNLGESQEIDLWRAGAHLYLPDQYALYQGNFRKAKGNLIKTNSQFRWFRDYKPVQAEFSQLLGQGNELLKKLEEEKNHKAIHVLDKMNHLRKRIDNFHQFDFMISGGMDSRRNLVRAEVILNEARSDYEKSQYLASEDKLRDVEAHIKSAGNGIASLLTPYQDVTQITKWREWAEEAIEESRERRIYSLLVIKANRELRLYKNGKLLKTYLVGLGRNGLLNKRHAKDNATPEGKYKIIRKNARSHYYKALLINYPNNEDKRKFHRAKKKGHLPKTAHIGGLIEIHGGSKESITYGCISMDNDQIDELYDTVSVGTPVTIIGTWDNENNIASTLSKIQGTHGQ